MSRTEDYNFIKNSANSPAQTKAGKAGAISKSESIDPESMHVLLSHERYIFTALEHLKRNDPFSFTLSSIEKHIKEATRVVKSLSPDSTLLLLLKQNSNTEFLTFAFLDLLEDELDKNDQLHSYCHSALLYNHQNAKSFMDFLSGSGGGFAAKKKDNPFGVAKKENVSGAVTKTERKMLIKHNTMITLAFLKKICRAKHARPFNELMSLITKVESDSNGSNDKIISEIKTLIGNRTNKGCVFHDANNENVHPNLDSKRHSIQPVIKKSNLINDAPKKAVSRPLQDYPQTDRADRAE